MVASENSNATPGLNFSTTCAGARPTAWENAVASKKQRCDQQDCVERGNRIMIQGTVMV